MTTLLVASTRHCHTENFSGEMHRYLLKNIQREGRAGSKNCESNMGKMIDSRERAVKYVKAQDRPIFD